MKMNFDSDTLIIGDIDQLSAASAADLEAEFISAVSGSVRHVEIDLSTTRHVDCRGLGALMNAQSVLKRGCPSVSITVLNPPETFAQINRLTGAQIACRSRLLHSATALKTEPCPLDRLTPAAASLLIPAPLLAATTAATLVSPTTPTAAVDASTGLTPPAQPAQ